MSFFHEINVTELRDGITSLHGIHVMQWWPMRHVSFSFPMIKKKNCSWLRIAFVCFFDLLELACSIDWFYICSRQHWFVSFGFISSLLRLCTVRSIVLCEIWSLVWCCTSTYSFSSHTSPHYCSIYIWWRIYCHELCYILLILGSLSYKGLTDD